MKCAKHCKNMDIFNNLATGFAVALAPINLLYCFLGSFIGTAIGVLPVLGLMMVGYLAGGSMTKGLMMACLGLLLGTVGLDPIMGTQRFTYGIFKLSEGFEFILVAMGLFGIGEVLVNVEQTIKAEVF